MNKVNLLINYYYYFHYYNYYYYIIIFIDYINLEVKIELLYYFIINNITIN